MTRPLAPNGLGGIRVLQTGGADAFDPTLLINATTVAVTATGTSAIQTVEICTLSSNVTRTLPSAPVSGAVVTYILAGSYQATLAYTLTVQANGTGNIAGTTQAFTTNIGGSYLQLRHRGSDVWDIISIAATNSGGYTIGTL